jgi:hypothetical protein
LGPVPGEDPWLNRAARGGLDWLQNIGFETSRSSEGCASLTTVIDPFEFVHQRADALDQLSKTTWQCTWQPLYASLNPDQKQRLRFFAVHVLSFYQAL